MVVSMESNKAEPISLRGQGRTLRPPCLVPLDESKGVSIHQVSRRASLS